MATQQMPTPMPQVTISGFKDAIYYGAILNNEALLGWGMPGIGKTEAPAQVVLDLNMREIAVDIPPKAGQPKLTKKKRPGATLCDIRVSQYESVDFRGMPESENKMTVWNLPSTLPFIGNPNFNSDPDHIIILALDEFTHGSESTSAVCYQLINERRVGEHVLMPNVFVIAMSNREGDKSISRKMSKALGNRFIHVEVVVSVDEFCAYAQKVGMHPMGPMFLRFKPEYLSTFMVPDNAGGLKVTDHINYATPRTWEKALKIYADPRIPKETKIVLMGGAIGVGLCAEFWAFEQAYDQLSKIIPAIMKNPKTAPIPEARDVLMAVTVALSGSMTEKNADIIHTYYKRIDREYLMLGWIIAQKRDGNVRKTDAWLDFSKNYSQDV